MRRAFFGISSYKLTIVSCMAFIMVLLSFSGPAHAYEDNDNASRDYGLRESNSLSSYEAVLYDSSGEYPGVYVTAVDVNEAESADVAPMISFPSLKDATLAETPTVESPAIICGTSVPWADKEHARGFLPCSPERVAPYSYFRYGILEQQGADGIIRPKLSGFDGTYYIVRIDISKLWENAPEGSFLHVSQEKNNALLVAVGMDQVTPPGQDGRDQWGNFSFSNLYSVTDATGAVTSQYQRKTASYKLSEMFDTNGKDTTKPYFDVIVFSTASIVSGADAQKEGALTGDIELNFYIDQVADYDKSTNWDPASQDVTLADKCFKKFYDEEKARVADAKISRYVVKGSELHLETMVMDKETVSEEVMQNPALFKLRGVGTTFWSLEKSMEHTYYDQAIDKDPANPQCGCTITLMSEVPVIDDLVLIGSSPTELRKRTLNVNTFDVQVANNSSPQEGQYTSGLVLQNAWLKIADYSNTTGAELAIGNNATMTIDSGGKLIIDRTCQLEIEWDGATTQPASDGQEQPATSDILNNGSLDLRAGGELQNDGVVTIEGTEGKPYQPGQEKTTEQEKGHGELTIRADATFTNNGCFMVNGALYVQGNLVNNGKFFDDPLVSVDPDKGQFVYHRGIQSTWKDDVTQKNIIFGGIYVGMDKDWKTVNSEKATLTNFGDIILCPGEVVNEGTIKNMPGAHIYSCATDKAIVPIEPDPNNPTVVTKEVLLDGPQGGSIYNWATIDNQGTIQPAQVTISTAGYLGDIVTPGNYPDFFVLNMSDNEKSKLTGTGYLYKHDLRHAEVELVRNKYVVDSVVYNGQDQWFDVIVTMGNTVYTGNRDFSVTIIEPNGATAARNSIINAGEYKVLIKGQETFANSVTKLFTVKPAPLTEATLNKLEFTYNAAIQKPSVTSVKAGSLSLKPQDYTIAYSQDAPKSAGTYKATITGRGNYTGTITKRFSIKQATLTAASLSKTAFTYNGKVQKPNLKAVKAGKLNATYTAALSNKNPKNAGTYKVAIKGTGNFNGSVVKLFKINKANNPMILKGKTSGVKSALLSKANQLVKRVKAISISKAQGAVTYKLTGVSNAQAKKYFSVNAKTGDIVVKKGLKKGTYRLSIFVKAAGNANVNPKTEKILCSIDVI